MSADEAVREVEGSLDPWRAEAFSDLLGVMRPDFDGGASLPLCWHWLYLLDHPRQQDLGDDGHPVRGAFPTPPAPGLRRMWAGGSVDRLHPLRAGRDAVRRSRVTSSRSTRGRSGALTFLEVEHEIVQGGVVAVRERQDIVYRDPPAPSRPVRDPAAAPGRGPELEQAVRLEDGDWSVAISPTLLMRFSALTYNAHRIHFDRDYARAVEGYPALVTHGPLQAMAMAEALRAHPEVDQELPGRFDYRLVAPLFEDQGLIARADLAGDGSLDEPVGIRGSQRPTHAPQRPPTVRTSVRDTHGRVTAQGTFRYLAPELG